MLDRLGFVCAAAVVASLCVGASDVEALSMQECSARYKAAKTAKTLNGKTWNQFRKDECGGGADAKATSSVAPSKAPASKTVAPPKTAPTASKAVFPTAISPKHSKEAPGKARMRTCLDQYNANKAGGGNGGLNWIQKNGGYYSECNRRLKG